MENGETFEAYLMKQPEKKRKKTGEYKPVNNCTLCKRITKNI